MKPSTRVIRAGIPKASPGGAFLPGPTFASAFHASGDPAASPFTYARFHNPTWTLFEQALTELEGGPAVAFASGMAAVTAVLGAVLRPGDIVVLPSDGYYTTRVIGGGYFTEMGVVVKAAPTRGDAQKHLVRGAKLLWLESPCNPHLDVCDISSLASLAHAEGVLVAVDNTTPTMAAQNPLALGADFSVASDAKALTGHTDLILGHVAARDQAWADRIRTWRTQTGAVPGPMEVWLAHRGLGTLELRLERQCRSALAVAQFLSSRPEVVSVRYPGLPSDPAHPIASRQMRYFGQVVTFTLSDRAQAERFLGACTLVDEATSFGGLHTTAERRARWGSDTVPDGLIRMSVGAEDADDIIEDIAQALA